MSDTIGIVLYVAWMTTCGVIVFLVLTRRGWWKRTEPELDWTTTADCPRCNEHGPFFEPSAELLSSQERARDLHQALHEVASDLLRPIVRMVASLTR